MLQFWQVDLAFYLLEKDTNKQEWLTLKAANDEIILNAD